MSHVCHPNGWLSVVVTERAETKARSIRAERDLIYSNIYVERETDERWVGDLGELVFDRWLRFKNAAPFVWHLNDAAGKADFTLGNGCSVGVKTVKRKGPPKPGYTAQVTARHAAEPADQFFFMTYEFEKRQMWMLGGIRRTEFLNSAIYYGPGEWVHPHYQVPKDHEIYNAEMELFTTPNEWLSSAG